jgi:hypothetical protein
LVRRHGHLRLLLAVLRLATASIHALALGGRTHVVGSTFLVPLTGCDRAIINILVVAMCQLVICLGGHAGLGGEEDHIYTTAEKK